MTHKLPTVALAAAILLCADLARGNLSPVALRCEYRSNPLGIDETRPRLSWRVESPERGQKQTAYRILVASAKDLLARESGDLWDSGKIAGDDTVNVSYQGRALRSREQCFWKVCVWDKNGQATWSEPAGWTMGLLEPSDWTAKYISARDDSPVWKDRSKLFLPPARQYRREFAATKTVKRATVYATAMGIYELYLNGKRVGDARFAPGWTDYHQRAYYNTYDVTGLVKNGDNAVGVWLGDGWYAGYIGFGLLTGTGTEKVGRATYGKTPAFMGQLEIQYADGSRDVVATNDSWKVTDAGPVREGDFLMGETYDARKEMSGWTTAGFDDAKWEPVILAENMESIPATFYEAATVDGCNRLQVFIRIVLPLALPGIATSAIFSFIFSWNEFLYAMVLTTRDAKTLPLGIYNWVSYEEVRWGELTAAAVLAMLPVIIFYLFIQKALVRGLPMGAVKG